MLTVCSDQWCSQETKTALHTKYYNTIMCYRYIINFLNLEISDFCTKHRNWAEIAQIKFAS